MIRQPDVQSGINIRIPWDSNTAKGFAIAVVIMVLFWLISPLIKMEKAQPREISSSIPIELLNFGSGDGTGKRSGNLTEEGKSVKGNRAEINIEDAQIASNTKGKSDAQIEDASKFIASNDIKSNDNNNTKLTGTSNKSVGKEDGSDIAGTGLKDRGTGRGAGDGFGDIDWGGGGNRVLLSKKLPQFPKSVKSNARIELRFKVLADGSVSQVIPLQKADPALEQAAINAIKQWRFNPLQEDKEMWGTIPLTFILR
ncbi:MAG: TonB family protein [Candidatus Kapaibacterium sp.]